MIKIITDSTSYTPKSYAKKNDIAILQLKTIVGDKEYIDGDETTYNEFFDILSSSKVFPKTSQPSVEDIETVFKKVLADGNEAIVVTISSALSGTYQTCLMVKEQIDKNNQITVIDSGITAQNIFCYVEDAVEMVKQNKTRSEIVEHIENLKKESSLTFIPDNLEFLKKGGRIGKVSAILGSILQVKPILRFKGGVLTCVKKSLGMPRAVADLTSQVPEKCKKIFLLQIAKSKYYEGFKAKIMQLFSHIPIFEGIVGHAVGAHIGPAIGMGCIV